MNTERHQTDNNLLAEQLFSGYDVIKPYINIALIVIIAAMGLFLLYRYHQSSLEKRNQLVCEQIFKQIGNSAELQKIAQDAKGTKLCSWAWTLTGNNQLAVAANAENENAKAKDALLEAENAFKQALEASPRTKECEQMSHYGLARVYEQMAVVIPEQQDSLDKALAEYEILVAKYPNCFYSTMASDRIIELKNPETQKFIKDYASRKIEEPKQPASELPMSIQAPAVTPAAEAPKTEEAAPATPAPVAEPAAPAEAPKTEEAAPATPAPAAEPAAPAEAPKAEEAAPAAPAPAAEPAAPAETPKAEEQK